MAIQARFTRMSLDRQARPTTAGQPEWQSRMSFLSRTIRMLGLVCLSAGIAVAPAHAQGSGDGQASCGSAEVAEAEAQTGGRMMSGSQQSRGGQTICQVTVLIPPQGDGKPRRQVVTIRR